MVKSIEDMDLSAGTRLKYQTKDSGFYHDIDLFHDEDLKDILFGTFALGYDQFLVVIEEYILSIESRAAIKQRPDIGVAWEKYEHVTKTCGNVVELVPIGNGLIFDADTGNVYKADVLDYGAQEK